MENLLGRCRIGIPQLSDQVVREPAPTYTVVELVLTH